MDLNISFDCSSLIYELQSDIAEFGDIELEVVVQKIPEGILFKDYNFKYESKEGADSSFDLKDSEMLFYIRASKLLRIYQCQNDIFHGIFKNLKEIKNI
jgi:hypothetical protein